MSNLPGKILFQISIQALWRKKMRTLLTVLAISIGICAVITIMSAGKGMQKLVLGQLDIFGADTLSIETKVPSTKKNSNENAIGQASGITITTLREKDIETIQQHPNILTAYGMVHGQETVGYEGQLKKVALMGYGYQAPDVEKIEIAEGRFFSKEEEDSLAGVAILGPTVKEYFFGDAEATGKNITIRRKTFRIVGTLQPRGSAFFMDMDDLILLPTKTIQKRLLGIEYLHMIIARMKDINESKSTAEELGELIRINHHIENPERDDFAVNTMAEAQSVLKNVTGGLTLLLVALVCISLVVGGVGIMNIMYVSVAERTFEIGLRKALGATKKNILLQFLTETVCITLGGGIVGILLGAGMSLVVYFVAISKGLSWMYQIPASSILLSVIFSITIGIAFGFYPAKKAANLNPIEALRKE